MSDKYIVVQGSIAHGLRFYGPYDSWDDAYFAQEGWENAEVVVLIGEMPHE